MEMFVQEVRRFYPFAPFLGAKVRQDFQWERFPVQQRNIGFSRLIRGQIIDPKTSGVAPYEFQPERFKNPKKDIFDFIPQGGGIIQILATVVQEKKRLLLL